MSELRWRPSGRSLRGAVGADLLLPCDGGPSGWRRVPNPPPAEIEVPTGVLVLDDSDARRLRYVHVPR